jgi:hypothetical protein
MALAFLPVEQVYPNYVLLRADYFQQVQDNNPNQLPALNILVDYLTNTWLGDGTDMTKIQSWNVNLNNLIMEDQEPLTIHRTNNDLEGHHYSLSKRFGTSPNFWKFVNKLKEEQIIEDQKFASIEAGNPVTRRLLKYRTAEIRIKAARENFAAQRINARAFLLQVTVAIVNEHI